MRAAIPVLPPGVASKLLACFTYRGFDGLYLPAAGVAAGAARSFTRRPPIGLPTSSLLAAPVAAVIILPTSRPPNGC